MTVSEQKILEFADAVIDEFGYLLGDYGIVLPNKEKEEYNDGKPKGEEPEISNIFGTDYYRLEDAILEHLNKYFDIQKEE
jgi:hypothetical protein